MALGSPGVEVQVIDESFYTPAAPGTVPMVFIATAQDKSNAAGTGTAQGTIKANAGKVWVITSQRDLVDTFGAPSFKTDASGNAIHGDERNEYGLQAAYSLLGASSRAYVVRADLDLSQLDPTSSAPAGAPTAGQYWVDTDAGVYGVNEWNATTSKFSVKTPLIIDGSNVTTAASNLVPNTSFGKIGDYALVITSDNQNKLWYKKSTNEWAEVANGFEGGKHVVVAPHTSYPAFNASTATGSVWVKTTPVGGGANWSVKYYNGSTRSWSTRTAPIYSSTREALEKLDYTGGGTNIPVGNVFIESNYDHATTATASFKVWRRAISSPTTVSFVAAQTTSNVNGVFFIRETLATTSTWGPVTSVTVIQNGANPWVENVPAAVSAANLTNVSASYDAETDTLTFTHALGGDFEVRDHQQNPLDTIGLFGQTTATNSNFFLGPVHDVGSFPSGNGPVYLASGWRPLTYVAKPTAPTNVPEDGTFWFANNFDVDIMINSGGIWRGYREIYPDTDPNGPIVAATEPTTQSDGTPLVNKDVWVSTDSPENYGQEIYIYDSSITVGSKWVLQDVTDQETPDGWVFADARWATSGSTLDPSSIKALLSSNYVDPDAPDPALYPTGVKLWNTRRSGNNIKKYISNYINIAANGGINIRNGEDMIALNYTADRWVSQENRNEDGSGRFGRKSQRAIVVQSLKSMIDSNSALKDTDTLVFNLMATPGYVETVQNMLTLNADRGYTAFVVGDTPFRLEPNGTTLTRWGSNSALATDNGEEGLVSYDDYGCLGVFYPSGFTNDLSGNNIVVPPSHMMLRAIINSDAKSYQWFAPAGLRRGGIDNATSVGYIDSVSGEYKTVALHEGLRDVLQGPTVKINPIATLPGIGLVNFGQLTRYRAASALDRINVARLVAYLRRQLGILAKPFLFEPNDEQTRREIKAAADSLLLELIGQRALYDFITVCDSTNNTPARIDRNELWLDIAIEPVKAVEFIYIPLRIKNTGEISAGI
jgi:hypothetical protein